MSSITADGYPSLAGANAWGVPERGLGVGAGVHFSAGNPSELHELPAITGLESEPGFTPYNEPLVVAPLVAQPRTCTENCEEQQRLARVHCDIIRKRVAQWLKDTGCASSVRAFKQKRNKCGSYTKPAYANGSADPTAQFDGNASDASLPSLISETWDS